MGTPECLCMWKTADSEPIPRLLTCCWPSVCLAWTAAWSHPEEISAQKGVTPGQPVGHLWGICAQLSCSPQSLELQEPMNHVLHTVSM